MCLLEKARLLRTSGTCLACDSRFTDELVLALPARAVPGGWAYVELRHVAGVHDDATVSNLHVSQATPSWSRSRS